MLFQNFLKDVPAFSHTYGETSVLTSGATPLYQIPEYLYFCIIIIIKIQKCLFNTKSCITSLTIFFYLLIMICMILKESETRLRYVLAR